MLEKIKTIIKVHNNQENLFTSSHRRYKVTIKYNGKQYTTEYHCNKQISPKAKNILECLILDMYAYDNANDLEDFANEFGYEPYEKETKRIYKACGRTSKAMHRMFTEMEIDTIEMEVNDLF